MLKKEHTQEQYLDNNENKLLLKQRCKSQTQFYRTSSIIAKHNELNLELRSRVVTGDETWLHHWDPERKWRYLKSMQSKHNDSPRVDICYYPYSSKVMPNVFDTSHIYENLRFQKDQNGEQ